MVNPNRLTRGEAIVGSLNVDEGITDTKWVQFNTTDVVVPPDGVGNVRWNSTEGTIDVGMGGGNVTQQVGLERFVRVSNDSGTAIPDGKIVYVSGADAISERPRALLMRADGIIEPRLVIGMATEPIASGSNGLVTTEGIVHGINTSGSTVGETWASGSLLFVHPTVAGEMTSIIPTVPNIELPIGIVLKADAVDGTFFVRPSPRHLLFYGTFSDSTVQTQDAIGTAKAVSFDAVEETYGVSLVSGNRITCVNAGRYNFQFSLQLATTTGTIKAAYLWPRINGADVANTAGIVTVTGGTSFVVPSWNFQFTMLAGHYFQLMWAVDSTNIHLQSIAANAFHPAIPSALLTVNQIN